MKKFSKVLTLNKLHIIDNVIGSVGNGSLKADYFNIGSPIGNPPLLRGSIVIDMNILFLTDNRQYFKAGSPVDTGSLKFGFLKPNIDRDLFLQMVSCDYEKFHALTVDLFSLPSPSLEKLNSHRACNSLKPVIQKYFSTAVIDFMYSETNPHAWLFEFCLDGGYALTERHIEKMFIPNTYMFNSTIRELSSILKGKIVTYNPKYGIEGRET
ncbi:hypothetical protein AO361_24945 [Pseudomonas fluorescens]|uniref:hypothetical protein n=1 Tax=Pseudomonas TaxID=286 RepID=UPI00070DC005|nr:MULTISPECIES: hypothetical protein [Pseudomonas]OOQ46268.1 hypothetical protein AO361_24945 [Pseudomonas fluorescens]